MKNKTHPEVVVRDIGTVINEYGGILTKVEEGVYYIGVEGCFSTAYQEIPKSLFDELNSFQDSLEPAE